MIRANMHGGRTKVHESLLVLSIHGVEMTLLHRAVAYDPSRSIDVVAPFPKTKKHSTHAKRLQLSLTVSSCTQIHLLPVVHPTGGESYDACLHCETSIEIFRAQTSHCTDVGVDRTKLKIISQGSDVTAKARTYAIVLG